MKPIYLDYNATTPIAGPVAQAMMPFVTERFGNPSSAHYYGFEAQEAVETARIQTAALIGCRPAEIVFTGSATEANNLAILGTIRVKSRNRPHIITSAVEHPAVLEVCRFCRTQGADITVLPVDSAGLVDPDAVRKAIITRTVLITIMHANNEVGTVQPIAEIGRIAREKRIVFHTDAAQSAGKIPVNVEDLNADLLTVAAHKFYGPKGVGVLYVREGVDLRRILHGAGHESGRRPGTENVIGIVGLGAACRLASETLDVRREHLRRIRDRLHRAVETGVDGVRLNGHPERRLPNTLSLGFRDLAATDLLNELDELAVSAGAACHTPGQFDISHVLEAMCVPAKYARGTLRFSTGMMTTEDEIDRAADRVIRAVESLRAAL